MVNRTSYMKRIDRVEATTMHKDDGRKKRQEYPRWPRDRRPHVHPLPMTLGRAAPAGEVGSHLRH